MLREWGHEAGDSQFTAVPQHALIFIHAYNRIVTAFLLLRFHPTSIRIKFDYII